MTALGSGFARPRTPADATAVVAPCEEAILTLAEGCTTVHRRDGVCVQARGPGRPGLDPVRVHLRAFADERLVVIVAAALAGERPDAHLAWRGPAETLHGPHEAPPTGPTPAAAVARRRRLACVAHLDDGWIRWVLGALARTPSEVAWFELIPSLPGREEDLLVRVDLSRHGERGAAARVGFEEVEAMIGGQLVRYGPGLHRADVVRQVRRGTPLPLEIADDPYRAQAQLRRALVLIEESVARGRDPDLRRAAALTAGSVLTRAAFNREAADEDAVLRHVRRVVAPLSSRERTRAEAIARADPGVRAWDETPPDRARNRAWLGWVEARCELRAEDDDLPAEVRKALWALASELTQLGSSREPVGPAEEPPMAHEPTRLAIGR